MSQLTQKDGREQRVHVGAFVPREQRDQLFELAARRDRSVSSIVRLALQAELERDGGTRPKELSNALVEACTREDQLR